MSAIAEFRNEFYSMFDARNDKEEIREKFDEDFAETFIDERDIFSIASMWNSLEDKAAVIDEFNKVPEFKEWIENLPEPKSAHIEYD